MMIIGNPMHINYPYIRFYSRSGMMILAFMLLLNGLSLAQADKKFIRHGNKEYAKDKFPESEIFYRKAIDKNKVSADAVFNAGDALYKQKKYEDAGKQFVETHKMNEDKDKKSASLYNLGNSMLMANKLKESIEAYKNSLRLKPDNQEAKYNLAYAQDLLKKQQEQQKQQQQQQQNKDNKDQNKDQDNKDKENKNQDKKQNDKEKQNNDKEQQQQQQQDQQSISKEDAERLLNAIANDEKNVQEKVKLAKAAKTKVKTLKNW
jgi:tetratricopeptide (TPR) repeat protein